MCFCTQLIYSTSLLRTDPLDTCPVCAWASMTHLWSCSTPFHVHTLGQHSCHTPGCSPRCSPSVTANSCLPLVPPLSSASQPRAGHVCTQLRCLGASQILLLPTSPVPLVLPSPAPALPSDLPASRESISLGCLGASAPGFPPGLFPFPDCL